MEYVKTSVISVIRELYDLIENNKESIIYKLKHEQATGEGDPEIPELFEQVSHLENAIDSLKLVIK